MTKTYTLPNRYVGPLPVTKAQYQKAALLAARFNQFLGDMNFVTDYGSAAIVGQFGSITIGILPDGSSHS